MSRLRSSRSFFDRISRDEKPIKTSRDSRHPEEEFDVEEEQESPTASPSNTKESDEYSEYETDGQLAVDVYSTKNAIYIKAMVAGVKKGDLDIKLTRDQVILRGTRKDTPRNYDHEYLYEELYWGSFSRIIDLPDEVEIDEAEANEEHGLLTIKLPRTDKGRSAKLRVH